MAEHMPYAYQCTRCDHLSSRHELADDGDLRDGPYLCTDCDCERPQDGPDRPLTRRQYEAIFGGDPR